jgi:nicotinamide-nucleotide amidase
VREAFAERLRPPRHRYIHTTGIPESRLAQRVEALLPAERGPVRLAYLPSLHGVTLRFTVPAEAEPAEAAEWLGRMEEALGELARYRYEGPDLVAAVSAALERVGKTVAVGESCTGGLLAKRLTDRPGSSRTFLGGVVAYSDAAKTRQLGVPAELIARVGAVSDEVARAMATGAARAFGADAGVGITGIAGPDGGTPDKPVGTVCYAVALGDAVTSERRLFAGDREAIRERSAQAVLHLLHGALGDAG